MTENLILLRQFTISFIINMPIAEYNFRRIAVVGAGRGPLVQGAINALIAAGDGRKAHILAIEKNPNAYVTLQDRISEDWKEYSNVATVELIFGDMRIIDMEDENKVDILISELLGSFGDNELSPECLDGAMRLLKRK